MNTAADQRIASVLARLGQIAPSASLAAGMALNRALGPLRKSIWPQVAWQASRLTDDGFPVEFSWSSRDAAVRWTAEVAGPEIPEADRLDLALALVETLQGIRPDCPTDISALFAAITPPYRFGCWLGGRHDANGSRTKLYIELPDGVQPDLVAVTVAVAVGKQCRWRMVGWDTQSGYREFYSRIAFHDASQPALIARKLGFIAPHRLTESIQRLLTSRQDCARPLGSESGLSITLSPDGEPLALCWFGPSHLVHPVSSRVRSRICASARTMNTSMLNALVSDDGTGRIGLVGAGISADGTTWYQAGCRP